MYLKKLEVYFKTVLSYVINSPILYIWNEPFLSTISNFHISKVFFYVLWAGFQKVKLVLHSTFPEPWPLLYSGCVVTWPPHDDRRHVMEAEMSYVQTSILDYRNLNALPSLLFLRPSHLECFSEPPERAKFPSEKVIWNADLRLMFLRD